LSKTFDSFDATLRLAAMTDQTDDFRDYITNTQKMRAYRGKIESTSPLAKLENPTEPPRMNFENPVIEGAAAAPGRLSNFIATGAIVVLVLVAIGLTTALVMK